MKNFRQFYGETPKMEFACTNKVNSTVIHGMNGAGKTALLNAFTWALYDQTTRGFSESSGIINKLALREAEEGQYVEAWVELEFSHANTTYLVRRCAEALRGPDTNPFGPERTLDPTMKLCGPDGEWINELGVRDMIERVLPPDLQQYFFFDGERIERIVEPNPEEQKRLARATKRLLGIELLDLAIKSLEKARTPLNKEAQESGDKDLAKAMTIHANLEESLGKEKDRLEIIKDNLAGFRQKKFDIEERLKKSEDFRHFQEKREFLESSISSKKTEIRSARTNRAKMLSQCGAFYCLNAASQRYLGILEEKKRKKELPSGIKDSFVHDILDSGTCICGTNVSPGQTARGEVQRWLGLAGNSAIEDRAMRGMGQIVSQIDQASQKFEGILESIKKEEESRKDVEIQGSELHRISEILLGSPDETVSGLENEKGRVSSLMEEEQRDRGRVEERIERLIVQEKDAWKSIENLKHREKAVQLAQRRVAVAKGALERLKEKRGDLEEDMRKGLEKTMQSVFRSLTTSPFEPKLDSEFRLRLTQSYDGKESYNVDASQGEHQALGMTFLAGLIQLTRDNNKPNSTISVADHDPRLPLVMDSPFGALDPHYRRTTAEQIPNIADQIVLLVSPTQWRSEVAQAMNERVGNHYCLEYHTPKDLGKVSHAVTISGRNHPLVVQTSDGTEFTRIVEID